MGVALDAAARGYRTLLLEQSDFAKGTSSRSTKLVHGGVRYLAQGNVKLVYEALYERGLLLQNAPHLVKVQPFVIACYSWWSKIFYGIGLKVYDWMAEKHRLPKTTFLSGAEVKRLLPNLKTKGLKGGICYYDGQFDDARLALNLAQTCAEHGGVLLNYVRVTGLVKDAAGKVAGVMAQDLETGREYQLQAKVVINATGVFADELLHMDSPSSDPLVRPSQGVHVVVESSLLPGNTALMIPRTSDGRVLFALPWYGHVLLGTTDTPLEQCHLEPTALEAEISFILHTAGQYLSRKPQRKDVLSVFAGLRPLAAHGKYTNKTKEISRSHKLLVSFSGLVTITGGKWTTYRKMAEDTVEAAVEAGNLSPAPCTTAHIKIHGAEADVAGTDHLAVYGSDAAGILTLIADHPELGRKLHTRFPNVLAEVVWAARHEMARTVEDVLARRLRILFLDARAAIDLAPDVAAVMAAELGYTSKWQQEQVAGFTKLANQYLVEPYRPLK